MKVYVSGYRPNDATFGGQPEIGYDIEPKWRMVLWQEAVRECQILNNYAVHIGEHCCEVSIEKLPEGDFAMCVYPTLARLRAVHERVSLFK
jgi:hypothetical protein